jgi:hypothetical protein
MTLNELIDKLLRIRSTDPAIGDRIVMVEQYYYGAREAIHAEVDLARFDDGRVVIE